jgi:sugar phosphate isomerase/epimerase
MTPDPLRLAINQMTTERWTLTEAIEGYARRGVHGIGVWRPKLEECGIAVAARVLRACDMTVTALYRGGMFTTIDRLDFRAALSDSRRAVDEAHAIDAECLVLVAGGLPKGTKDLRGARATVRDAIAELLPYARQANVPLAIEPTHPLLAAERGCVNTLAQAIDLCDQLGEGLGLAVDVHNTWWDPDLEAGIARAGEARLLAFAISDWLVPTRDPLADRGMMGDGVIDIPKIRGWMEATGWCGFCEVAVFSAGNWRKRDPGEVVEVCRERFRTVV